MAGVVQYDVDTIEDDAEVPTFWQALGLPGLIDIHVHFLPGPLLHKVWKYFDRVSELGLDWPIRYRTPHAQRLGTLRALGVRAFSALAYPHKPGMAAWLNEWTAQFAAEVPECLSSATFYPEPGMDEQMRTVVERGVDVVKAHLQVGAYDPETRCWTRSGDCSPRPAPRWCATAAAVLSLASSPARAPSARCSPDIRG